MLLHITNIMLVKTNKMFEIINIVLLKTNKMLLLTNILRRIKNER